MNVLQYLENYPARQIQLQQLPSWGIVRLKPFLHVTSFQSITIVHGTTFANSAKVKHNHKFDQNLFQLDKQK